MDLSANPSLADGIRYLWLKILPVLCVVGLMSGCAHLYANKWDELSLQHLENQGLVVGRIRVIETQKTPISPSGWRLNIRLGRNLFSSQMVSASNREEYFAWVFKPGHYKTHLVTLNGFDTSIFLDNLNIEFDIESGQVVYVGDLRFHVGEYGWVPLDGYGTINVVSSVEDSRDTIKRLVSEKLGTDNFDFIVAHAKAMKETQTAEFKPRSPETETSPPIPQNKFGVIPNSKANPKLAHLTDVGLAENIKTGLTGWNPVGKRNVFAIDTKKILWYGRLSDLGIIKESFPAAYRIEWVAPNEIVYLQNQFKPSSFRRGLLKSELILADVPRSIRSGEWLVQVWRKSDLIDEQRFKVIESEEKNKKAMPP